MHNYPHYEGQLWANFAFSHFANGIACFALAALWPLCYVASVLWNKAKRKFGSPSGAVIRGTILLLLYNIAPLAGMSAAGASGVAVFWTGLGTFLFVCAVALQQDGGAVPGAKVFTLTYLQHHLLALQCTLGLCVAAVRWSKRGLSVADLTRALQASYDPRPLQDPTRPSCPSLPQACASSSG